MKSLENKESYCVSKKQINGQTEKKLWVSANSCQRDPYKMWVSDGILSDRLENAVGKGQHGAYQHFLLFPQRFKKPSSSGCLLRIVC